MILLDNAAPFIAALQRLNYVPKTITTGSANSHILIHQVDAVTLELTAYGMDGAWLKQSLYSTNTAIGIKYLFSAIDLPGLKKKLNNSYSLQISQFEGDLSFSTFDSYNEDGTPKLLDTISLRQYHGAIEDFGPPNFLSNVSVTVSAKQFIKLLTELNSYGEYNKSPTSKGVYLIADSQSQTISLYGTQFECYNFYVRLQMNCEVERDFKCMINGQQLEMLSEVDDVKSKDDSVITIGYDKDWITITGVKGCVNAPTLEPELYAQMLTCVDLFDNEKIVPIGYRTFSAKRFNEALAAQEPSKEHTNRHIEIESDNEYLVISKSADIRKKEQSKVLCLDLESLATEWVKLPYNAVGLQQATKMLDRLKTWCRIDTDEICLLLNQVNGKPDSFVIKLQSMASDTVIRVQTVQAIRRPKE